MTQDCPNIPGKTQRGRRMNPKHSICFLFSRCLFSPEAKRNKERKRERNTTTRGKRDHNTRRKETTTEHGRGPSAGGKEHPTHREMCHHNTMEEGATQKNKAQHKRQEGNHNARGNAQHTKQKGYTIKPRGRNSLGTVAPRMVGHCEGRVFLGHVGAQASSTQLWSLVFVAPSCHRSSTMRAVDMFLRYCPSLSEAAESEGWMAFKVFSLILGLGR